MNWNPVEDFPYKHLENSSEKLYKKFVNDFDFDCWTFYPVVHSFEKFLSCDRSYNSGIGLDQEPPYRDHAVAFWKRGTNRRMYVFHPYYYDSNMVQDLEQWCNERELCYTIYSEKHSFYYPGNTKMITIVSDKSQICEKPERK